MVKDRKLLIVFIIGIFLFLISFSSAENWGYNSLTLSGTGGGSTYNNNTYYVNGSSYNATYAKWAYNQTTASIGDYNYNETTYLINKYGKWWYNMSDGNDGGSSFNATYDTWLGNFTAYYKYWYNMSDGYLSAFDYNMTDIYTAGSNLTLIGNEFSLDTTALKNWLDTIYATIGSYFTANDFQDAFNSNLTAVDENLNVNSSNYWDNLNSPLNEWSSTFNSTYNQWAYNQSDGNSGIVYTHLSNFTDDIDATSTYNATYNLYAYNQSDGYLSPYDYNQSQYLIDTYGIYWYNMSDGIGTGGNSSFNQTLTDTLYAGIKWGYNQTYSGSTYNATYNQWAYNQSDGTGGLSSWVSSGNYLYNETALVGIGTSTPTYKLDVQTGSQTENALGLYVNATNTDGTNAYDVYAVKGYAMGTTSPNDVYGGYFEAYNPEANYGNELAGIKGISDHGFGVYGLSTANYGVVGSSTSGAGVLGSSTSYYGIAGSSTSNYAGYFTGGKGVYVQNNLTVDTNTLVVNSNLNRVGIGTASPSGQLEVNGAGSSVDLVIDSGSTSGSSELILKQNDATNDAWGIYSHATSNYFGIYDYDNSTDRFVITDEGNVGIGIPAPTYNLQVNGSAGSLGLCSGTGCLVGFPENSYQTLESSAGFYFDISGVYAGSVTSSQLSYKKFTDKDNGAYHIDLDNSTISGIFAGKVGIGTATPTHTLNVVGTMNVTGNTYYNSGTCIYFNGVPKICG